MTLLIAHRGNTTGPKSEFENTIPHLQEAVREGYDVEVDIWYKDNNWYLGHDAPTNYTTIAQILSISPHSWFHAKNYDAFIILAQFGFKVFAHENDPYALTNKGIVWSHNGMLNPTGIVCMPDLETEQRLIQTAFGVCHDHLDKVKDILSGTRTV